MNNQLQCVDQTPQELQTCRYILYNDKILYYRKTLESITVETDVLATDLICSFASLIFYESAIKLLKRQPHHHLRSISGLKMV